MERTTKLRLILLPATIISLTGCAVLTVDVDVYKGPLANHKDVQIEQMAAMAIGAKPLLVELRDMLEAKDHNDPDITDAPSFRQKANEQCWYKSAYIGPAPEGKSRFKKQNADRVNEILSLYEDRADEQYSLFVRRARKALKDYKRAYQILQPDSNEPEIQLWKEIGLEPNSFNDEAKLLIGEERRQKVDKLAGIIEDLRGRYERFFKHKYRGAKALFTQWNKISEQLRGLETKNFKALRDHPLLKDRDQELQESSNAAFRALAETSLVNFQAEHLFGLKGKKKEDFVNHVKEVSREFFKARDALERLWRVEMELIIWLDDQPPGTIPSYGRRMLEIAEASLEITQSRHVVALLDLLHEYDPNAIEGLAQLRSSMQSTKPWYKRWRRADYDYDDAEEKLLREFQKQPAKTARRLLEGHKYSMQKVSELTLDKLKKKMGTRVTDPDYHIWHKSGWDFGFACGPFKIVAPREMTTRVKGAFPMGAFGKGRLDKGLERLIEEYLNQAKACDPNDQPLTCARNRLSDALVRFGQKVLFVANNNSLIQDPDEDDPGLIWGLVDATGRGLFGWHLFEKNETYKYVRVLQAVGNSILVQADALCQEEAHEKWLERRRDRETDILKHTLSKVDMDAICPNVIVEREFSDRKEPTAKDVRDVWITLLRYEHDLALSNSDPNRAMQIERALKAAEEKRAGMIYIRPAMAYLRTSFPATSLQDNPNLTWDNMLGGHMMRSMPFGPQFRDFLDPTAKCDARINAEIDKQFWQNINRVRVAGGGDTNYVVAKDDIGNWYVKGYSADPKDVIESAKNLALFSLSAKTEPGFLAQLRSDEGEKAARQESDIKGSSLGRLFSKYKARYDKRTKEDYDLLYVTLEDKETTVEGRIKQAWEENKDINPQEKLGKIDILGILKSNLTQESKDYLQVIPEYTERKEEETKKQTQEREKEEAERPTEIINTLDSIRRFHNALTSAIGRLYPEIVDEQTISSGYLRQQERERAERAEKAAIRAVTSIVRQELMKIIVRRKDAVKDYETAIMFMGDAGR
jgi:hypothetical protein